MEEHINNSLKRSFLSLIPRSHRRHRASHASRPTAPAASITHLKSGLPQAQPSPAYANRTRRRRPHSGYSRGSYLQTFSSAGISQPMFRIG